jgi:outer membrane protein OmpA-like peptidoglycan-associated protein
MQINLQLSMRASRFGAMCLLLGGMVACSSPATTQTETGAPSQSSPSQATGSGSPERQPPAGIDQRPLVKQALSDAGLSVSDTPEGLVKASIPSDTAFGLGRTTVGPAFGRLLDKVAGVLTQFPDTTLEIVGHTDSTGTDALNLAISRKRAESTRDHLVARQVAATRISTQGWGADQPVEDNNTAAGRSANRRVELFVRVP